MELQALHDHMLKFVRDTYVKNTDPTFDVMPMLHIISSEEHIVVAVPDGRNPLDIVSELLNNPPKDMPPEVREKIGNAQMISFCTAIWRREPMPDGTSGPRCGEGVMIITESHTERICEVLEVKRNPLPELFELDTDARITEAHPRVPLLYHATRTEH